MRSVKKGTSQTPAQVKMTMMTLYLRGNSSLKKVRWWCFNSPWALKEYQSRYFPQFVKLYKITSAEVFMYAVCSLNSSFFTIHETVRYSTQISSFFSHSWREVGIWFSSVLNKDCGELILCLFSYQQTHTLPSIIKLILLF